MNAFVAKEIRLLRPALVVALLLAVVPMWVSGVIVGRADVNQSALWIGLLMLALSSFGREFELRTFSMLLAQPVTRRRVFGIKSAVLVAAILIVFAASFLSAGVYDWWILRRENGASLRVSFEVFLLMFDYHEIVKVASTWVGSLGGFTHQMIITLVVFAGGLWASLLLRQIAAAFWFAILIPLAILAVISNNEGSALAAYVGMSFYSAAGIWWAWHQFQRAQEVGWTGGAIVMPEWKRARRAHATDGRAHQPVTALLRKEAQLYQVAILAMAGLFVLHLGAVLLRGRLRSKGESPLLFVLDLFAGFWFAVPLLAGGLGVADERQMGTLDSQFSLPVSKRLQFVIKMAFAIVITGLFGGLLPWIAEATGDAVGAGGGLGGLKIALPGTGMVPVLASFLAAAFVAFYASTLTRSMLQAAGATAATAAVMGLISALWHELPYILAYRGLPPCGEPLLQLMGWPAVAVTLLWLAYGNFRGRARPGNFWLHNASCLGVVVLGMSMSAVGVYNRAWELVLPLEPTHGPARLAIGAPRVNPFWCNIAVLLPDGRLWEDAGLFDERNGKWRDAGGGHFLAGTNWMAERKSSLEDAGIRSDGTLWVSTRPVEPLGGISYEAIGSTYIPQPGVPMIQFGTETNWLEIAGFYQNLPMILLKTDSTLWRWGSINWRTTKSHLWPGLASFDKFKPTRLGTASNWARLLQTGWGTCVWDRDGLAWKVSMPDARFESWQIKLDDETALQRWPGFDHVKWKRMSADSTAGVREDGTLWAGGYGQEEKELMANPMSRIGSESNWVAAAVSRNQLVASKIDGSLWKWDLPGDWPFDQRMNADTWEVLGRPPKRLGKRGDWVAAGGNTMAIAALAADGSLWLWYSPGGPNVGESQWLTTSRKPEKVANIFGEH